MINSQPNNVNITLFNYVDIYQEISKYLDFKSIYRLSLLNIYHHNLIESLILWKYGCKLSINIQNRGLQLIELYHDKVLIDKIVQDEKIVDFKTCFKCLFTDEKCKKCNKPYDEIYSNFQIYHEEEQFKIRHTFCRPKKLSSIRMSCFLMDISERIIYIADMVIIIQINKNIVKKILLKLGSLGIDWNFL